MADDAALPGKVKGQCARGGNQAPRMKAAQSMNGPLVDLHFLEAEHPDRIAKYLRHAAGRRTPAGRATPASLPIWRVGRHDRRHFAKDVPERQRPSRGPSLGERPGHRPLASALLGSNASGRGKGGRRKSKVRFAGREGVVADAETSSTPLHRPARKASSADVSGCFESSPDTRWLVALARSRGPKGHGT